MKNKCFSRKISFILLFISVIISSQVMADDFEECNNSKWVQYDVTLGYKADFKLSINGAIDNNQMFYSVDDISDNNHPVKVIKDKSIQSSGASKTTVDIIWDVITPFAIQHEPPASYNKKYKLTIYGTKYRNKLNMAIPIEISINTADIRKCLNTDIHIATTWLTWYTTSSYIESASYHPSIENFKFDNPDHPSNIVKCLRTPSDACALSPQIFNGVFTYNFSATIASRIDNIVNPKAIPKEETTNLIKTNF